jgi:paraquat-inducible protein B
VNSLVASIDRTSVSIRALVESVDTAVGPLRQQVAEATVRAEESMANLNETLGSLQTVVDPEAPVVVGLVRTLEELELTARSLRRVAELLERDPAILVRGRSTGGGS